MINWDFGLACRSGCALVAAELAAEVAAGVAVVALLTLPCRPAVLLLPSSCGRDLDEEIRPQPRLARCIMI